MNGCFLGRLGCRPEGILQRRPWRTVSRHSQRDLTLTCEGSPCSVVTKQLARFAGALAQDLQTRRASNGWPNPLYTNDFKMDAGGGRAGGIACDESGL